MSNEAREFSAEEAYETGDLVMHHGVLYVFIADHSAGEWDGDDADPVDREQSQKLTRLLAGYDNAITATTYAGRVNFSPTQITGTQYKYTFIDA